DGGAWRRLGRQQLGDAGTQARRAERRLQRGQHGNIVFFANLPDGLYHDRVGLTDDEDLAAEILADDCFENFADIEPVDTYAEHDQVRLLRLQYARQIAGLTAFAGHEAEILESVGKEQTKVLFAVDDAGSGRQLPVPEMRCARILAKIDLLHAALQQIPRRQSYIRVEVAITEFCGRSQDYFSRVKAADTNKSLRRSSWLSGALPKAE